MLNLKIVVDCECSTPEIGRALPENVQHAISPNESGGIRRNPEESTVAFMRFAS